MIDLELALRLTAYLLSCISLLLAAWVLADLALPGTARLGVRLLATLSLHFVFTATLVQLLGLCGGLRAPWYLAASLLPGMAAALRERPRLSFLRLPGRAFRQLFAAPGPVVGGTTAFLLIYFSLRYFNLPHDVDTLTMHGPLVAEWVQSGRVTLASQWNYPQCWEYQFVPGFLLLRSDALAIGPGFLAVFCLFLVLRELAAGLGAGGRLAHLAGLLYVASPVVWRDPLKGDPIFAFSQLLAVLAIARAGRGARGSFWLMQAAIFLMLGTKASGYFYAALLLPLYLAAAWLRSFRGRPRPGLPFAAALVVTLFFHASAAAVQIRNQIVHGSLVYPVRWQVGELVLLDGPTRVAGTSILDHGKNLDTWLQVLAGGRFAAGVEWPFLFLILAAASLQAGAAWLGARRRRDLEWLGAAGLAWLLWVVFLANPWSFSLVPDPVAAGQTPQISGGHSLRFALAPLGLTYLVAAVAARRWLPRQPAFLPAALCLALVYLKWRDLLWEAAWPPFLPALTAFLLAALLLAGGLAFSGGRAAAKGVAARRAGPRALAAAVAAGAVLFLAVAYLRQVESYRRSSSWVPKYRALWTFVWDQIPAGSEIATNHPYTTNRYFLYGPRFENRLVIVPPDGDPANVPAGVNYFYYFVGNHRAKLPPAVAALRRQGWRLVASPADGRGALLARP